MDWLLNWRGGSFAFEYSEWGESLCKTMGVTYQLISASEYAHIKSQIARPEVNADIIRLEKAPRIAVYAPSTADPWDDAVMLVLDFVGIPYDRIYDEEVLAGKLVEYDWLHLHHEDFTGQYGKFWVSYRHADWYQKKVKAEEERARRLGFDRVSKLKLAVAQKIKEFVAGGGYLFSMCSGTDSYDIALAAQNTDICDTPFDGDPPDPACNQELDFEQTLAFWHFHVYTSPFIYEFSDIDMTMKRNIPPDRDFFVLKEFSAKVDPVPTMLTQNHQHVIKGFMGQTTAFDPTKIKPTVVVMGYNPLNGEARYIYGQYGYGFFVFYGGHDPEDYQHFVGDPPTDLSQHPTSPGYRLILNNVLFPAASLKKRKT